MTGHHGLYRRIPFIGSQIAKTSKTWVFYKFLRRAVKYTDLG